MKALQKDYCVFIYDSRNTGYDVHIGQYPISIVRDMAAATAKEKNCTHYSIHETGWTRGDKNYFEEYENGEKVSWSA
jgi:hypothetical protein